MVFILPLLTQGQYLIPIKNHVGYHLFDEISAVQLSSVYPIVSGPLMEYPFTPSGLWLDFLSFLTATFPDVVWNPKYNVLSL